MCVSMQSHRCSVCRPCQVCAKCSTPSHPQCLVRANRKVHCRRSQHILTRACVHSLCLDRWCKHSISPQLNQWSVQRIVC
jgi:hypothetical protein